MLYYMLTYLKQTASGITHVVDVNFLYYEHETSHGCGRICFVVIHIPYKPCTFSGYHLASFR